MGLAIVTGLALASLSISVMTAVELNNHRKQNKRDISNILDWIECSLSKSEEAITKADELKQLENQFGELATVVGMLKKKIKEEK